MNAAAEKKKRHIKRDKERNADENLPPSRRWDSDRMIVELSPLTNLSSQELIEGIDVNNAGQLLSTIAV